MSYTYETPRAGDLETASEKVFVRRAGGYGSRSSTRLILSEPFPETLWGNPQLFGGSGAVCALRVGLDQRVHGLRVMRARLVTKFPGLGSAIVLGFFEGFGGVVVFLLNDHFNLSLALDDACGRDRRWLAG